MEYSAHEIELCRGHGCLPARRSAAAQQDPSAQPQDGRVPGPFRVVNGTGQEGLQFYLVKPGRTGGQAASAPRWPPKRR
ncbi:hypothetical protein ACFQU7_17385 [Pseudoroseomonas wenyumeiae]